MRTPFYRLAAAWGVLLLAAATPAIRAEGFKTDLGQAKEIISSRELAKSSIPHDAQELTVYPIAAAHPRQVLTSISGESFLQVTPMPLARAWWSYPVYAVAGLPRDLIDAAFGGLNMLPVVNIPVVMGGYELVPTQLLMRDPRDWHRWPGVKMNALGHGPLDGDNWGWFPTWHCWHFTYPSQRLARRNEIHNQKLQGRIDTENQKIEAANSQIDARLRETRNKALEAIAAGNGKEAACRMISYRQAYPLDEGGFALFATALALHTSGGPDWVAPVLWSELEFAQPRLLAEAEKMLVANAQKFPDRRALGEALIYSRLVLGRNKEAIDAAQMLLKAKSDDPYRQRLVFETALTARNLELAKQARAMMNPASYDGPTRDLMDLRLKLADGDSTAVLTALDRMRTQTPEDAYLWYYLACAQINAAQRADNPADAYQKASALLIHAIDAAPGPALRMRAEQAQTWVKSVLAGISGKPELFGAAPAGTAGASGIPAKPEQQKPAKKHSFGGFSVGGF